MQVETGSLQNLLTAVALILGLATPVAVDAQTEATQPPPPAAPTLAPVAPGNLGLPNAPVSANEQVVRESPPAKAPKIEIELPEAAITEIPSATLGLAGAPLACPRSEDACPPSQAAAPDAAPPGVARLDANGVAPPVEEAEEPLSSPAPSPPAAEPAQMPALALEEPTSGAGASAPANELRNELRDVETLANGDAATIHGDAATITDGAATVVEEIADSGDDRPRPTTAASMTSARQTATPQAPEAIAAPVATSQPAPCLAPAVWASFPREQDEIWLVSSYGVGCGGYGPDGPPLQYWRYVSGQGWIAMAPEQFWSSLGLGTHVSVALHGNRMDMSGAVRFGWGIYGAAVANSPLQPPMRFVAWAWPSEKARGGPMQDARIKAARADVDARALAWFVGHLPTQSSLSLTGYSFGARIIGGALELVAGGAINGLAMPASEIASGPPAQVVLMASAIDNDWLLPGRRYGMAMSRMSHLTLINNGCDRVLRFYGRMVCRRGGPEALGYTGQAAPGWLGADLAKLEQHDVCCIVGKPHDWERYVGSPTIASWISAGLRPMAGLTPVAAVPAAPRAASPAGEVRAKTPAPAAPGSAEESSGATSVSRQGAREAMVAPVSTGRNAPVEHPARSSGPTNTAAVRSTSPASVRNGPTARTGPPSATQFGRTVRPNARGRAVASRRFATPWARSARLR